MARSNFFGKRFRCVHCVVCPAGFLGARTFKFSDQNSPAITLEVTAGLFHQHDLYRYFAQRCGHAKTPTIQTNAGEKKAKDAKTKTGPEVAKRVNQLKSSNKQVKNALKAFENNSAKNGRTPRVEESWAMTGTVTSSALARAKNHKGNSRIRKVSLKPQETFSDYGIEIIFVPTYSTPSEWQGTAIFNLYDSSGNFLEQYVADVVMTPDSSINSWNVIYEVSFEGGGAYLESDPALGMITSLNFEWGTSAYEQPIDPQIMPGLISSMSGRDFRKASFSPAKTVVEPQSWKGVYVQFRRYPPSLRFNYFMKCSGIGCGSVLLGCGAVSLFFAGTTFAPCAVGGCVTAVAGCAGFAIFRL